MVGPLRKDVVMDLIDMFFIGLFIWFMVFAQRVARVLSGPAWFDVAHDLYSAVSVEDFELARRRFEAVRFGSRF
jgi:hypothetical protein